MVRLLDSSINFKKEIIIVYDSENDNAIDVAKDLANELQDVKLVHNKIEPGVRFAVESGVNKANYDIILITAVDEIFPIIAIDKMISHLIKNDLGAQVDKIFRHRLGGSTIGSIFSRVANNLFKLFTNIPLSDCTTGIKMMKKTVWETIKLESKPIGWAYAFELSIKVYLKGFKIDDYPLKSVDRLFVGSSTFKFGHWLKEYLRWFI